MPVVTRIEVPPPEPFVEGEDGAEAKGAGYRFIAPRTATEPLVMEAADGSVFLWTPTELCYKDEFGQIDFITGSAPVQLEVRGREARYRRTFPASDEVHIAQPEGRKYWLILHERPRDPSPFLQGEIWFGVSGIVAGIPLPPGIHKTFNAFAFDFRPPFAADLMDAQTECWYEVVDTENGQMLFIWCRADWLLAENRVYPVKVDPTVGTTTTSGSFSHTGQWKIAAITSGVHAIIMVFNNGNNNEVRYSLDDGETWHTPTAGAVISTGKPTPVSLVADQLGRLHAVAQDGQNIHYWLGIPSADRTQYTWTPWSTSISNLNSIPRVAATAIGNASYVAISYMRYNDRYRLLVLKVDGPGAVTEIFHQDVLKLSYSGLWGPPVVAMDSQGTVYVVYPEASNSRVDMFSMPYPYSGPPQPAETVAGVAFYNHLHAFVDDQDRLVVVYIDPNKKLRVFRRNGPNSYADLSPDISIVDVPVCADAGQGDDIYCFWPSTSGLRWARYRHQSWTAEVYDPEITSTDEIITVRKLSEGVAIGFRAGSASPYTVMFEYAARFNQPPLAPSNLTRGPFDATEDAPFIWQHNDRDPGDGQAKYQLQIRLAGLDTDLVDTGEVQSPVSRHILSGGTLENGKTYQWRVRTADQAGEWSPWSDYAVFQTGPKPVATILYPAAGATVSTSEVTVEWSVPSQSSATVRLYDGTGQTVLQEHEVTTPSARQRTITGLENNQSYQVSVQPVSGIGVVGDEVFSGPFSVQYTPPPKPTATAAPQEGFVRISIVNPAPTGDQPVVASNELWRREPGKDWVRVAAGIAPDGTYDDYATASGVIYEYRVRAIGANGTYSDSDVVAASLTITGGIWLHDPRDPENTAHHFMYHELPSSDHPVIPSGKFQFAGRKLPVVQMDASQMERIVRYRLYLSDETDDRAALEALYERRTTLCLRNHRGKKYYVVFTEMPLEFERRGAWADVEFQVVDFDEEV